MNLKYTAEIVQAYVANNEIPASEIPNLIQSIHRTLTDLAENLDFSTSKEIYTTELLGEKSKNGPSVEEETKPFIDPSSAVSEYAIVCLICGKELKALKGHLSRTHGIDVSTYRRRFNLDVNFPMVSPAYSEKRRQLAKETRLGERQI